MKWMLLVLLYGVFKGIREIVKKKALERNTVLEVLVMYTILSFVIVLPTAPQAMGLTPLQLLYVALKSFAIFCAWICSFQAIKELPVSLYGVLDLSRVLFSTTMGVVVLHETLRGNQMIGLVLVCIGLLMLKRKKKEPKQEKPEQEDKPAEEGKHSYAYYVVIALLSCLLNGISGTMDKVLTKNMTGTQLQFWYMLFLVLMYLVYILCRREKLNVKSLLKNYWIWILSILFVIADRALFEANAIAESRVTVMTLLKQAGCIVTILGGRWIFHEKNTGYKLVCAGVIIAGIVIAAIK